MAMGEKRPDPSINFSRVGGLREQIQAVKEMVLFPLMYKEVHERYRMKPPRGVLFYGPPGTGKTLVASALASECSQGDRKVSFFSRKATDILGMFLGESEQRLHQIFERARLLSPSIIFFDEIDGLAPSRDGLGPRQHVHASIVSILLTEMDGIGAGQDVFVIGATNRIDSLDPALRRPGRFDRELRFSLPNREDRQEILRVHTSLWRPRITDELIKFLARETHGHCGSDLQAICAEAVMCSLRRTHPDIGTCTIKKRLSLTQLQVLKEDFQMARAKFVPAAHRMVQSTAKGLPEFMEPLFREAVDAVVAGLKDKFPYRYLHRAGELVHGGDYKPLNFPRLLLTGTPDQGHTSHLAPAILHHFEHLPVVTMDVAALFANGCYSTDVGCIKVMESAKNSLPAILFLPDLTGWWGLVGDATRLVFTSLLDGLSADTALLLVATSHLAFKHMPDELQDLFVESRDVIATPAHNESQREQFFAPLILGEVKPDADVKPQRRRLESDDDDDDAISPGSSRRSSSTSDDQIQGRARARKRCQKRKVARRVGPASSKKSKKSAKSRRVRSPAKEKERRFDLSPIPSRMHLARLEEAESRRVMLLRLVRATDGFASRPLERAFGELSACFGRWEHHKDKAQLFADLNDRISHMESDEYQKANVRQNGKDDDDDDDDASPSYLY